MRVSKRTIKRVVFLLVVLSIVHAGNVIARDFSRERETYKVSINELESTIDNLNASLVETENLFKEKLMTIAVSLYERDYYSMGGYTTQEGESLTVLYETILNEVRDYRSLLLEMGNYFDARKEYVDSVPSVWPIEYNELTRITSGFGWRLSPITGRPNFHGGIDMTGVWNSRVIATADGVVVEHWPPPGVYGGVRFRGHRHLGGMVKIQHEGGIETVYGHLRTTNVVTGQRVSRGDVIGIMGNTGISTGIHLHYEIHVNGVPVDPVGFLRF